MASNSGEHSEIRKTSVEEKPEAISDYVNNTVKDADFSSVDIKTGMRNNANRKSAASSKERRKRYIAALERAVQSLRTQSTSLSSQLNILEEDTNSISTKNIELKLRMQSMENEVHLQDARNESLKKEIQELRAMIRQSIENGAPRMSFSWSQNQQLNQYQQQKQLDDDFDMSVSPSPTENSSNTSPSNEMMTAQYNDYRLF